MVADKYCFEAGMSAAAHKQNVIWDQTNLRIKKRKKILNLFPDYYKIAVVIECSDETREQRLKARKGKNVPDYVVKRMKDTFERPTAEEGFDYIITMET